MGKATKYKHKAALSVLYSLWWTVWFRRPLDALTKQLFCNPHRAAAFNCLQKTTKKKPEAKRLSKIHFFCWSQFSIQIRFAVRLRACKHIFQCISSSLQGEESHIMQKSLFSIHYICFYPLCKHPRNEKKKSICCILCSHYSPPPKKMTIIKICSDRVLPFMTWQIAAKPRNNLSPGGCKHRAKWMEIYNLLGPWLKNKDQKLGVVRVLKLPHSVVCVFIGLEYDKCSKRTAEISSYGRLVSTG